MSRAWSDLSVGEEIVFVKGAIDKVQLVKYAGASADYNLIHTDDETARRAGLPGVIAQGMLSMGFLGQFMGELAGPKGYVKRLHVRFGGITLPGKAVTCKARVTEKDAAARTIEFDLSAGTDPEKPATVGSATVQFPVSD